MASEILNIAFYRFVDLTALTELREKFQLESRSLGLKGTILLSHEGINGFLAGTESRIRSFQSWISRMPEFSELTYKESWSSSVTFNRMLVKIKKEIISMGIPEIRPHEMTGERLPPRELKRWYDEKRDFVMMDTRNDYEMRLGTFERAMDLGLKTFRQFPERLKEVPDEAKSKPVVMFCTGGIRCEKATSLALQYGFKNVYQLEGGILKYFEECQGDHFQGECFVFDHRVAVDPSLNETKTVQCFKCRSPVLPEEQTSPKYVYERSCPHCA